MQRVLIGIALSVLFLFSANADQNINTYPSKAQWIDANIEHFSTLSNEHKRQLIDQFEDLIKDRIRSPSLRDEMCKQSVPKLCKYLSRLETFTQTLVNSVNKQAPQLTRQIMIGAPFTSKILPLLYLEYHIKKENYSHAIYNSVMAHWFNDVLMEYTELDHLWLKSLKFSHKYLNRSRASNFDKKQHIAQLIQIPSLIKQKHVIDETLQTRLALISTLSQILVAQYDRKIDTTFSLLEASLMNAKSMVDFVSRSKVLTKATRQFKVDSIEYKKLELRALDQITLDESSVIVWFEWYRRLAKYKPNESFRTWLTEETLYRFNNAPSELVKEAYAVLLLMNVVEHDISPITLEEYVKPHSRLRELLNSNL